MGLSTLDLALIAHEVLSAENQTKSIRHALEANVRWTAGSGAGQANAYFSDRRSLAATSEVLDLDALTDGDGNAIAWTAIKLIAIRNRNTTAGEDLNWGPDATNGWGVGGIVADASDRRTVPAGRATGDLGIDVWVDPNGHTVTGGSADEIFVDAGAATISYDILIIGTK